MGQYDYLLSEKKYESSRNWIINQNNHNRTWKSIKYGLKGSEEGLIGFLKEKEEEEFWDITVEEWYILVSELERIRNSGQPGYIGNPRKPVLSAPTNSGSCWIKYKEKLEKNGFSFESIHNMELSAIKVISQLSHTTNQFTPTRGIVVGNVQSGKTANMAAVMAMAADYGFNFFIVLSGTIDNLRVQTRNRLISDLNTGNGNLRFINLDNLSSTTQMPDRLQDLDLGSNDVNRYMTVCLKNSTRLRNLLNWLNKDAKKKSQLKVLVIDDEADQAGVNTSNISKQLKSTINKLIESVVFAKTAKQQDASPYQSMNYIGYTATPYANFLNEANEKSLYPKNFILTLNSPGDYNGPQQIFGLPDINEGLPIINIIDEKEIKNIENKSIYINGQIVEELEKAIHWFICTVAIFRIRNLKKPVSMLIHTSQRIDNHLVMEKAISNYFSNINNLDDFIEEIETTYKKEIGQLTLEKYAGEMSNHPYINDVKDYPFFEEIKQEVYDLLKVGIQHIKLNDEDKLEYSNGLHVCVDNCANVPTEENVVMRLIYPDKNDSKSLEICPAFIVIGGSTLSRGLTIEGLTCSYFLRTTTTADTLMQMGRWFGYRKKYELLPRIWMSRRSKDLFERLSKLDYDLREELHNMESLNLLPSEYGPRLDTFPDFKVLKITSKNKMQSAFEIECSYTNKAGQTTKFYNDELIIKKNYDNTVKFINDLGKVDYEKIDKLNNPFTNKDSFIWFDKDYNLVLDYLAKLSYPPQFASISDVEHIKEWFEKEFNSGNLSNWNVIVSGVHSGTLLSFDNFEMHLPNRRKLNDDEKEFIKLKAITAPNDRLLDLDCSKLSNFEKEELQKNTGMTYKEKRVKYGELSRPLLILYIIDKDSGKGNETRKNEDRLPLNIENHLVGYYIYIPYGNDPKNINNTNKITVKLNFDLRSDIDEDESQNS